MSVIIVDTETTGLPFTKPPYYEFPNPRNLDRYEKARLVEVGWRILNDQGTLLEENSYIIKPAGGYDPEEGGAFEVHKISRAEAEKNGRPIREVLEIFLKKVREASLFVAHNVEFDRSILLSEIFRAGLDGTPLRMIKTHCTMLKGMKNPRSKYPKLVELYEAVTERKALEAHRVEADVRMAEAVYLSQR